MDKKTINYHHTVAYNEMQGAVRARQMMSDLQAKSPGDRHIGVLSRIAASFDHNAKLHLDKAHNPMVSS